MCNNPSHSHWTDDQYIESDPLFKSEDQHLAMSDVKFAMSHDHTSDSITLVQRFTGMNVNEDGFSEPKPQQLSIIIPMGSVETIMLMLMENSICIATESKHVEGKGH